MKHPHPFDPYHGANGGTRFSPTPDAAPLDIVMQAGTLTETASAVAPASIDGTDIGIARANAGLLPAALAASATWVEVVFIEQDVADLDKLLQAIGSGKEIHLLDGARDGLHQMAQALDGRAGIDAIHIISHGADASLSLGSLTLKADNSDAHAADLQAIGRSLATDGDIMLYGCNVAAGADGTAWLGQLALATGADVAASNDLTGGAALGGDWDLEVRSGTIETQSVVAPSLANLYRSVLAISDAPVDFSSNKDFFFDDGGYSGADDVVYQVQGNSAYSLKVDGADNGVKNYDNGYVAIDFQNGGGETAVTISFTGGQLFSIDSISLANAAGLASKTLNVVGYKADSTQVSQSITLGKQDTSATPFTLSGMTEIATLKLLPTNGDSDMFLYLYTLGLKNIHLNGPDTTPPPAPSTPDMDSASDLGSSNSDNLTSLATPTFSGTAEAGSTVKLYDSNGTTLLGSAVATGGNWSITTSALAAGAHTIYAQATDAANNTGPMSTGLAVNIDLTAPTVTSIVRATGQSQNVAAGATSVAYTVTFSESVTGVDAGDFTLTKSGSANGAVVSSISGSGTTYTVTVDNLTGDGTLRLDLNGSGTNIKDAAGNPIGTGGYTGDQSYTLDHTGPAVGSVGVPADKTYTAGEQLDFTVNFNEAVTVNTTGGTPRIAVTLDTGGTVYADYVSGGGGTALLFRYTVVSGNADSNGVSLGGAIALNGGTLKDAAGNNATLGLNSVGALTGVLVNAVAPEVSSITLVDAATNNLATVEYTVVFSSAVTGVDASDFALSNTGNASGAITNVSGSGTTYTVTVGSVTGNGTLRLDLNASGTGIVDGASNAIAGGYTAGAAYTIDHAAPLVGSVGAPLDGTYKAGAALDFTVNFSEAVTVDSSGGTPRIAITLDSGGTAYAEYVSGSGTGALVFRHVVAGGEFDTNGVALGGAIALNGGAIKDAAGNNATLGLNGVGALTGVLVDAVAPSVSAIERVGAQTTNAASVQYTVTFSEDVTGVGKEDFTLDNGGGTATGTISGIAGSGKTYTVTVSGVSGDGSLRLDLKGVGTGIQDTAGNAIGTGGYTAGETYTLDHTAPTVGTVGAPANGTYKTGDPLAFTVNFDEAVTVDTTGGIPRIAVTLDTGGTVYAQYASGSGTSALVFSYTVASGNADSDGVTLGSAIDLHGGALKDAAGNDAALALNGVPVLTGVLVNGIAPEVSSITLVDAATNNLDTVEYTIVFSSAVTGVDKTDFALSHSGNASGVIDSISGSGTTYTIKVVNVTGNGTLRLDLNPSGTGIVDGASNAIAGGYTAGAAYTIDHAAPAIGSVGAPTDGTYKAGATLDFTVNFNEAVTVDSSGGTPRIAITLDSGGTAYAEYVSGSGTSALVFRHVVAGGEFDTNGVALGGAIALNGGAIKDAAGNDAALALNNIGALAGVLVDAVAPTVSAIERVGAQTTNAASVQYTVTFSEDVTGVGKEDFTLDNGGGTATGTISGIAGSGKTYTVTVSGVSGDGSLRLDLKGVGTGIQDTAGNAIGTGGYTAGQAYTLDHTAPTVGTVGAPANGTYGTGQALDFTVDFSEAVTVDASGGTPRIAVTLDTGGTVYAEYVSGGGTAALLFRYIVASGDADANGVTLGGAIDLHGATLKDAAGNNAALALNGVGALTGVLVNGIAPEVSAITLVDAGTNNLATVQYTVVFSSAVTGVDKTDFVLSHTGSAGGAITGISGSGTTYTVTVGNVTGDGTLRLDLNPGGTGIVDAHNNAIAGGYTGGASYTIDHTAPAAPGALHLDSASDSGVSDSDGITTAATPLIRGQGVAGSIVTVRDSDGVTVLGSAVVNEEGNWSVTPTTALGQGTHSITATQVDAAGNVSAASSPFALTIDNSAATAITLSRNAVSNGAGANAVVGSFANNDASGAAQATYKLVDGDGAGANGAFTIENGVLRLTDPAHTAAGTYSVRVQVTDAAGNAYQQAVTIQVTNPPVTPANPPTTVDGVPVQTSPVTLPGGGSGTAVVVPVVQPGRTETDGSTPSADIPLATANGGNALVAHVPAGLGLTSTGGASQAAGSSLDGLIAAILARTPDNTAADQAHLTGDGRQFLALLDTTQPLLVNTVVLGGDSASAPLVLTGTADSTLQTALVIDTTTVTGAGNVQVTLEDVAFAAVVGRATVRGATDGQVLTGDNASQHFVVGAGVASTVVQSGGGDDVLELAAGAAPAPRLALRAAGDLVTPGPVLLNGGAGADKVVLAGSQAGYAVERGDGHVVVTDKASGASTTLVNVEALQFADATLQLESRAELGVIAALYVNTLGRQADVSGFEFWGHGQRHAVSLGEIAIDILKSGESVVHGNLLDGDAAHDVALLYHALFGRAADAQGAAFWVDAMQHGFTLTQVADSMLASAEMQTHLQAATAWDFYF